ncbi:S8 family peptidase [Streptomyces clavuligerus]|uniref:S8 family peptidase n=1 Tax=Streptomyces clavuligerus TaxID=1901 RepID=UPI00020D95A8|nr:S8 family serine peptidase [Streptomyces clavuligerus]WDN56284.1 S8 family serine peptidase [Streptomyces clavuligerus]
MLAKPHGLGIAALTAAISVALLAGMTSATPSAAQPSAADGPTQQTQQTQHTQQNPDKRKTRKPARSVTLTLITGDRVSVATEGEQRGQVTGFRPAEGRERIPVQIRTERGHSIVVPADVRALLDSGRLDRRLFDVTELAEPRNRAAHRAGLRLIVGYDKGRAAAGARAGVRADGTEVRRTLTALNAEAVTVPGGRADDLWESLTAGRADGARTTAPGISRIWLDGVNRATLSTSTAKIGAPKAWQAGFDGAGVTIAVLDTGVDDTHPDLRGRVSAARNFSDSSDTKDRYGHGTHVASIAAGGGVKSAAHRGVAPGARVISAKVLNDKGEGLDSEIVAGVEWAVAQNADILNLSLGKEDQPGIDPLEEVVNRLSQERNVLFAIAAGNGATAGIGSPGSAEHALTVGATDDQDRPADFSGVGPVRDSGALKPDVAAPGVGITAASVKGSVIEQQVGESPEGYLTIEGTSMAAPHAAGAAALLKQKNPGWGAKELKAVLSGSAQDVGALPHLQGSGRIAVGAALEQSVIADRPTTTFERQLYPHSDNKVETRQITYRNLGTGDITLDLALRTHRSDGSPAPDGLFTLGAEKVIVPAGGTASVGLTADTRQGGSGLHTASVAATGGGQTVRTTASVDLEVESYEVTVRHIGRDGAPGRDFATELYSRGWYGMTWKDRDAGIAVIRAPKGTYTLQATNTLDPRDAAKGVDLLTQPRLTVDRAMELTVDARAAKPVTFSVGDAKAKPTFIGTTAEIGRPDSGFHTRRNYLARTMEGLRTAQIGPKVTDLPLSEEWYTTWAKPTAAKGDTEEFRTASGGKVGKLSTGYTKQYKAGDFATVRAGMGGSAKNRLGKLSSYYSLDGGRFAGFFTPLDLKKLPYRHTVHLAAQGRIDWFLAYDQVTWMDEGGFYGSDVGHWTPDRAGKDFRPGRTYRMDFGSAVASPSLSGGPGLHRRGNEIAGDIPSFADGDNHDGRFAADSRIELYRGSTKVASHNESLGSVENLTVPAAKAEYTLKTFDTRTPDVARASSSVEASYTFRSARTTGDTWNRLPLSTVRFGADTALDSTVPAGRSLTFPVTVDGAAAGQKLRKLTVEFSTDRGRSWRKATVTDGRITVKTPAKGASVSLRASFQDTAGNKGSVKVIDAYFAR